MRLSLVVPVYNVADYLPKCMESLLCQDFADFEIILVDDGSTDGVSPGLCDEYAARDPRVSVIHQENGGLGAARNTGLERARGEYLFFIDSDDYIAPGALSRLAEVTERTGSDIVLFSFYYDTAGELAPGQLPTLPFGEVCSLETRGEVLLQPFSACLRITRRKLFLDQGIRFPGRVWFEDLGTCPKCYPGATVTAIPDRLYYYVQRPGSIMHHENLRRNLEIIDALRSVGEFYRGRPELEPYLCYLAVDNCLLAAQRVLMADPKAVFLPDFLGYVQKNYPGYGKNPLLSRLGRKKRIVLKLLELRQYGLLRLLFTVRRRVRG